MSLSSKLYERAPVALQNMAVTLYGVLLRSRRYGGVHRSYLQSLLQSQWFSQEEQAQLQLNSLNRMLKLAASVPLYRNRELPQSVKSVVDFSRLQMTTKADLRAHRRDITARQGRAIRISTSGTSGTPLTVYCDRAALQRNYAFFERFRIWAGTPMGLRVATFAGRTVVPAGQLNPPFWRFNKAANAMLFSSYHLGPRTLAIYVEQLIRFQPVLIDSYPSSLELIARYLVDNHITGIRPEAIITSSETLQPRVRQTIETAFGCRVYDHYGSAEMVALVTQCASGSYHVNAEFGLLELVDGSGATIPTTNPGTFGEIVATGFINDVMPLIRYRMGDQAAWASGSCACGRHFPMLLAIAGRIDDVVTTPEGFSIGRLDPVFKGAYGVYESRIVQDSADHLRLEIVPSAEYRPDVGNRILSELRARVGPSMKIDLHCVDALPRTPSGKLRAVINEVTQHAE